MSEIIKQAVRDTGFVDSIIPKENRRAIQSSKQAIDDQGRVFPRALGTTRTPLTFNWLATSGERIRAARAGTAVLFAIHSVTPPSSGQLIVRLSQVTATSGESVINTTYVPQGTRIFEDVISLTILAGSWLSVDIQSAGGASGVSASLTMNVG